MKMLPFKASKDISLGIELELQIIDPMTFDMISRAKDLIRIVQESSFHNQLKPEVTQSMIEFNSGIHTSIDSLADELNQMRQFLLKQADNLSILFAGGGTHPFQKWSARKIFPTPRFKKLSRQYQYLSKQSTVFGEHIHIGCPDAESSLYLTHALARFVPQFIALSASSPFYQGHHTGYQSTRTTLFNVFPSSGVIPFLKNWKEFSIYFYRMKNLKIVETMKDFYWDIRPKPEYGTVEVRVCDTPLTITKALELAAYIYTIAHFLLTECPPFLTENLYYLYHYNRFQACRYGYEGNVINPLTLKSCSLSQDILNTIPLIESRAKQLGTMTLLSKLANNVINHHNDALWLNETFKRVKTYPKVVQEQCKLWKTN